MNTIYKQLFDRNLIDDKQYSFLDVVQSKKIISLYYELRLLLYLGIMLFTGGLGYFAYQNMTEIGHIISMLLIACAVFAGFYFINKFQKPYSNAMVEVVHPYFDYILILTSLLIISLFTYIQVYFDIVQYFIYSSSFISAGILLLMAYRFDNRALLSMGITALAAAFGVSVTPVDWVKGTWFASGLLYLISILLGAGLVVAGELSERKDIKSHFKFTYQNFGLLLFFTGGISAMFENQYHVWFAFFTLLSAAYVLYQSWNLKQFLFFLYSSIAAYISFTYLLFQMLNGFDGGTVLLVYYFPFSCIAYVVLLINKKSHFKND
ncbi:MAG: hypothetical protein WCK02_06325 [Bacteroidota bacterium]